AVLVVAFIPVAEASAAGRRHGVLAERVSVRTSKQTTAFKVRAATRPRATCGLLVRAGGRSQALPFLRADGRGSAVWSWLATRSAPRGSWRFTVRCTQAGAAAVRSKVRHLAHGRRRGGVGEPSSFRALRGTIII